MLLVCCLFLPLLACSRTDPPTISLYRAVQAEDIDQVERNLEYGAKIDQPGPDGLTALHMAVNMGSMIVVSLLLEHGADIEAKDPKNQTPLLLSLLSRNTLVAGYLVKHGASVDADALLLETVRQGQADREVITFLMKHGVNLNCRDAQGDTPLHLAIRGDHRVIAKNLVKYGADIDLPTASGVTPLQLAIEKGTQDIEKMLRANGARVQP